MTTRDRHDRPYQFVIHPAKIVRADKRGLRDVFTCRTADGNEWIHACKTAADIMDLARAQELNKGFFDIGAVESLSSYDFRYVEKDFEIRVTEAGKIFLNCPPAFALDVARLPSVAVIDRLTPTAKYGRAPEC